MKHSLAALTFTTCCLISSFALADSAAQLTVTSSDIESDKRLADKFSYCTAVNKGKIKNGDDVSPQLAWSGAPEGTKSFAIVMVDTDVPTKFENANKKGKVLDKNMPRQNFYHWVLTDIPANVNEIEQGDGKTFANGVSVLNDFSAVVDDKPAQNFLGYDGPCPPWNDPLIHHYHFMVFALDVEKLGVGELENSKEVVKKIEAHTIAKGEIVGTFSNYLR